MMFKNVFDGAKVRTFFQLFSVFPVKLTKSGEQHHDIFLLNHSSDNGVGSSDYIQKSVIYIMTHYLFHFHLCFVYLKK